MKKTILPPKKAVKKAKAKVLKPTKPQLTPEALYSSPEAQYLKAQICDIGRRLWQREYVDGNGGNISVRVGDGFFLCTPTGVSKGFLTPDMLCLCDAEGTQLVGTWKRTSEFLSHLAIFNAVPEAVAVCHAHPVHATAYAIAGLTPPERLIPEIEVFVGRVAIAPYATPGSQEMHDLIAPLAPNHQSILMTNHGVICWGTSVEDAYFKVEITDAFCRTAAVASHLPTNGTSISPEKMGDLLAIKSRLGLPDSRNGKNPTETWAEDPWAKIRGHDDSVIEEVVRKVTKEVLKQLGNGGAGKALRS